MRRALRENSGATAISVVAGSSVLLSILGRVSSVELSLETRLTAVSLALAALYHLQRFLVTKRRYSRGWFVQYGAMAAYYLPPYLVFYAAKTLYNTHNIDGSVSLPLIVIGVLLMFYVTLLLTPSKDGAVFTNMTAYSLRDRPQGRFNFLMWLVCVASVHWHCDSDPYDPQGGRLFVLVLYLPILLTMYHCTSDPGLGLDCETKEVADYMKRESTTSSAFFDDANSRSSLQLLNCCRYSFMKLKDEQWASIKDLFHQCPDLPNEDKDICLSYSYSRLLARRHFGFHCAEEGDAMVREFALDQLRTCTHGNKRRAFTIVEVQLAFLHDYFFTASSQPHYNTWERHIVRVYLSMNCFFVAGIATEGYTITGLLSLLVQIVVSLPVQFRRFAFYWRPIHTAFQKLQAGPKWDRMPPIPYQTQTDGVFWRNKIGQYSILQDYDRPRSLKKALVSLFQRIVLSQKPHSFIKHLPVEEDDVEVQNSVTEMVADTLLATDGTLTNGAESLKEIIDTPPNQPTDCASRKFDWSWTCKQETQTDTILIWHIATCYCDMSQRHSGRPGNFPKQEDAIALSRYCAYLVAFLPEFLPDNILTTKQVFQRVLQEAQSALGKTPTEEKEKYKKMHDLQLPDQQQRTTFENGVELGRQLETLNDDEKRWEVMAEFWAKRILYIAPSDNAEAHMEHLAKGGEFVTHIWALLSNAGILKRPTGECHQSPASTDTAEGPQPHQHTEASPSYSIDDEASTSSMSSRPIQTPEPSTDEKGKQLLEDHDQ